MASGRSRDGFRASPPACDTASKPMNDEKSTTHDPRKARLVTAGMGASGGNGMWRACSTAVKSSGLASAPTIVMTTGPTIIATAMMMMMRSYVCMPRTLIHQNSQIDASASGTRTRPASNHAPADVQPAVMAMSRSIGTIRKATTPMPAERPNHCAKLPAKPAIGSRPRVAYT